MYGAELEELCLAWHSDSDMKIDEYLKNYINIFARLWKFKEWEGHGSKWS